MTTIPQLVDAQAAVDAALATTEDALGTNEFEAALEEYRRAVGRFDAIVWDGSMWERVRERIA